MGDLLIAIEAFLDDTGMKPTEFGIRSMNDPTFVFGLRKGRDYRRSTEIRVRAFIAAGVKMDVAE